MAGVRVGLETGIRDTGLYDVVVTLDIACRADPIVLKRAKPIESDNRVVRVVGELLGEQDTMRSVVIDEEHVVLRWSRNVGLEQIDEAIQRIVEAWRTLAPYR